MDQLATIDIISQQQRIGAITGCLADFHHLVELIKKMSDQFRVPLLAGAGFQDLDRFTNGHSIPAAKPWMVNLIDTTAIKHDIAAARAAGAELVTACWAAIFSSKAKLSANPDP